MTIKFVAISAAKPHVIYAIGKRGAESATADKYLACGFTTGPDKSGSNVTE
jgi:hypothetical protein